MLWKDGTAYWLLLEDLKKANHMEVSEYTNSRSIDEEVSLQWWIPCVLKKIEAAISQLTSKIRRTAHKYGVEVLASLKREAEIDIRNKNTFWRDAIAKEMRITGVAFDMLETRQSSSCWMQ